MHTNTHQKKYKTKEQNKKIKKWSESLSADWVLFQVLEELLVESDATDKEQKSAKDAAGLPKTRGNLPSTFYATGNEIDFVSSLKASPKTKHKHKKSSRSE